MLERKLVVPGVTWSELNLMVCLVDTLSRMFLNVPMLLCSALYAKFGRCQLEGAYDTRRETKLPTELTLNRTLTSSLE